MKLEQLYRHYSHCHPEDIKELDEQCTLYEGLITSYPPTLMIQLIHNLNTSCKVSHNKNNPYVLAVTFSAPVDPEQLQLVLERTKVGGWFLAVANIITRGNLPRAIKPEEIIQDVQPLSKPAKIQIIFEAKYGYDVTSSITTLYTHLFHATLKTKVNKILQKGLSPRTQSKLAVHPERIYFACNMSDIKMYLIPEFAKITKTDVDDWTILQISISAFKQLGVRLFNDPAFPGGVYTLSNISPSFIVVVE